MSFGQKIKELRRKKNLTQEQLGDEIGLTKQAINKYEQDKSKPDHPNLVKLAAKLGVELRDLEPLWLTMVDRSDSEDLRKVKEALGDMASQLYIEQEKNKKLRNEIKELSNELTALRRKYGT